MRNPGLHKNIDRHHILRRQQFDERERASADTLANTAFLVSPVNKSINQSGPQIYLKEINSDVLASQCVPLDKALWLIERASDFGSARRDPLADAFNDFVGNALPQRRLG